MNIAIIGTGNVGKALGLRLAQRGYHVLFGSRDPQGSRVRKLLEDSGTSARATDLRSAAQESDVVFYAAPWSEAQTIVKQLGPLDQRVLVDCTNPLNADFSGLQLGYTTSAAEQIAVWANPARVVKAFNTVSAATMWDPAFGDQKATLFYCGDDNSAKSLVHELAERLGFDPIDCGPLANARQLEPLAMLYIYLAFQRGFGSNCAIKMMRRTADNTEKIDRGRTNSGG